MKVLILIMALLLESGCQSAILSSSDAQQKFFSSLKGSSSGEESALRSAHYFILLGRTDLALNELDHAIDLYPNNVRLLNAMGGCYDRLANYSQARVIYEKALALEPGNNLVKNNLGYSRYLSGDLTGAETIFHNILAENPNDTLARNNLGLVWCRQGKEKEALRLWQKHDGDIKAREKLHEVLAYLGKPVSPKPVALSAATAESQMDSQARGEATPKLIKISDKASKSASDATAAPVIISRAERRPTAPLSEVPVKIEEVPMVIHNASHTQSPADIEVSMTCPSEFSRRSTHGQKKQLNSAAGQSDSDFLPEDAMLPNRRSYRQGYWHAARKPKVIICSPQEFSKANSIKKCLYPESVFQPHEAGKPEMPVY